jgi:hypothetical protein
MTGNLLMKPFPITRAKYRNAVNYCIAAVVLVSVAPQFVHVSGLLAAAVLTVATGAALALRFFTNIAEDHPRHDHDGGDFKAEGLRLPVVVRPRPVVSWQKSVLGYHIIQGAYLVRPTDLLAGDPQSTNHFIANLLMQKSAHHKIPQTERMKLFLLNEFAGSESNPWIMEVPIGSVNLRIRGDMVELHVVPVRKQAARETEPEVRSFLQDYVQSRTNSIAH